MSVRIPNSNEIAELLQRGWTIQRLAEEMLSWRNLKSIRINTSAVSEDWGITRKEDGSVDTQTSINHPATLGCLYQLAEELYDAGITCYWTAPRFMWLDNEVVRVDSREKMALCESLHATAGWRSEHMTATHFNELWQEVYGLKTPKDAETFVLDWINTPGVGGPIIISVDYRYPEWALDMQRRDHHIYFRPYDPMVCVRNLMAAQEDKAAGKDIIISELGYWPTPRGESVSNKHVWTPQGIEITKGLVEIAQRITGELCLICCGPWMFIDDELAKPFQDWLKEKA